MAIVDGQRHQAGGWGFQIGDQMSGAILGRELVRYAVEAEDGLVPGSPLTKAVIAALGGNNQAVMNWSFATEMDLKIISRDGSEGCDDALIGRAPAEYGKLMPLFIEHFEQGDPVARKMMDLQLSYIDNYVRWFKARDAEVMAVVGGFGAAPVPAADRSAMAISSRCRNYEPLHGAVILAKQNFAADLTSNRD